MYKDRTPQWLQGNNSNELKNLFYEEEMARGNENAIIQDSRKRKVTISMHNTPTKSSQIQSKFRKVS